MSIWFISRQITAKHSLPGQKVFGYRHPVEGAIIEALNSAGVVSVYWGVWESGKSRAARNVALRFQEVGRLAILLDGYDFSCDDDQNDVRVWLRRSIGVPDNEQDVSKYFAQPTSIIIDHFDRVTTTMHKYADLMEALEELNTGVLLIVSSWERAVELRTQGCRMIGSSADVGRWKEDELRILFASLPPEIQEKWTCDDEGKKNELLRLSALSGTPGFLTFSAYENRCGNREATILDEEWRKGINALEGTVVVVGDDSDVGRRFPDHDDDTDGGGVLHWD